MAGEGIISIGATLDKTGVNEGADGIKEAISNLAVEVERGGERIQKIFKQIPEEAKKCAESLTASDLKAAQASYEVTKALEARRAATKLMKDDTLSLEGRLAAVAVTERNLTEALDRQRVAQKELSSAALQAAESAEVSSNAWVAAYRRMAVGVSESCALAKEKFVETAESGKLTAEGITSGFAGIGTLLGAGIAVSFAAHFGDELAKVNVELGHLKITTGMSITTLAGLKQIVKEMGGEWEPISTGLIRFNRALVEAEAGSKTYVKALSEVGLTIDQLQGKTPEEKLGLVAEAFQKTEDPARRTAAAIALYGKGGAALIPLLVEQGKELLKNSQAQGELTGVTDASVAASSRWISNMAKLTAHFQSFGNAVFENSYKIAAVFDAIGAALETVGAVIIGVADAIGAIFQTAMETVATAIVSVIALLAKLAKAMVDASRFDFSAVVQDAKEAGGSFVRVWKTGFEDIKSAWKDVGHQFDVSEAWSSVGKLWNKKWETKEEANTDQTEAGGASGDGSESKAGSGKQGSQKTSKAKAVVEAQDSSGLLIPQSEIDKSVRENLRALGEVNDAYRSYFQERIRLAGEEYADEEKRTQGEVQAGRMSQDQRLEILRAVAQKEIDTRNQLSLILQGIDANDARRYQEDLNQQAEYFRQYKRQIQQIEEQAVLENEKRYKQMTNAFGSYFSQFATRWMSGQQSLGASFQKMISQIALSFEQQLTKMLSKWIMHEAVVSAAHAAGIATRKGQDAVADADLFKQLAKKLSQWAAHEFHLTGLHLAANTTRTASDATSAATSTATTTTAATTQITANAGVAASGAAASQAGIPFAGPGLAAAAAAAMLGMVLAFKAFDAGGVVGNVPGLSGMGAHVPILAEAGERVLTPSQTANFERLVNGPSSGGSHTSSTTNLTANFHGVVDAQAWFNRNQGAMLSTLNGALKNRRTS